MPDNNTTRALRMAGVVGGTTPSYVMRPRKAMLSTTGNKAIAVVIDPNDSTAPSGNGDGSNTTKIYVYESTDRLTWSLINTITPSVNIDKSSTYDPIYACTIGGSGQVWIVYRGTSGVLREVLLTASTYTVIEDVQITAAPSGGTWVALDIDAMETPTYSPVLVVAQYAKSGSSDHISHTFFHRRSSDGAWLNEGSDVLTNGGTTPQIKDPNYASMVACTILGGPTDTAFKFAVASSHVTGDGDGGWDLKIKSLNPNTGGSLTAIATVLSTGGYTTPGSHYSLIPSGTTAPLSKIRAIDLFPTNDTGQFIAAMIQYTASTTGKMFALVVENDGTITTPLSSVSSSGTFTHCLPFNYSNGILAAHYYKSGYLTHRLFKGGVWGSEYNFDDHVSQPDNGVTNNLGSTGHSGTDYYQKGTGWDTRVQQDLILLERKAVTGNPQEWRAVSVPASRAPDSATPSNGSTVNSSEPSLSALADVDMKYGQGRYKMVWQFATDSGFTSNVRTFTEADGKLSLVDATDVSGTTVSFTDTLPHAQALFQGTWYVRAAHLDEFGRQGAWLTANSFTVSHPPSATPSSPSSPIAYGSGQIQFSWVFSDSYVNDVQTAFQVVVERVSDGASVYDSGKITSGDPSHVSSTISATYKDTDLRWKVRLYDIDDVAGSYTTPVVFRIEDPPTVAISVPDGVTDVATPVVAATFVPTVSGGRTIVSYTVTVYQGATPIYSSGVISSGGPWASGATINFNSGVSIYENNETYYMIVTAKDSDGLEGSDNVNFLTHWTPPDPAAGQALDLTHFNTEGEGYAKITWDDTARDADFVKWIVYRKADEIDPNTLTVIEQGTWESVGEVFIIDTTYELFDYHAPAGLKLNYRVAQVVNRFGDLIESEDLTAVSDISSSDGYWLIEPGTVQGGVSTSIRLSIITGDSYTDEYDEAELIIAGRGRYIDRGDHLGLKGTLDARIRHNGGTTARQKKRALDQLKEENRNLFLRTPFGDVYRVNVGNLSISRISGVGLSEFVDVQIPYSEVAE